jgi:hypothetical protein
MGKGGSAQTTQNSITQEQLGINQQQQAQSNQVFQASFPGFQTAESYYQSLASGNPQQIFAATAPAVGQINTATQGASQQIAQNLPRGGVEQMAQANLQQQRAGQVGNLATQAYTSSFPALASLSQGGMGLAANDIANAISAGSSASTSNQAVMTAQQQGKGSTMGFLGSLAGAAGQVGGDALLATAK